MRHGQTALLLGLFLAGPAAAQTPAPSAPVSAPAGVSTDDAALAALKSSASPAPRPAPASAAPAPTHHQAKPSKSPSRQAANTGAAAKAPAPANRAAPSPPAQSATMPQTPPVNPVFAPPPFIMPAQESPPPPPVPLDPAANGHAEAAPNGLRLIFGPGSAALNQAMLGEVQKLATKLRADPSLTLIIEAYAPGTAQDPSPARRLSLSRALGLRAALIAAGIESRRLYARALGFKGIGDGVADRAELTLSVGGGGGGGGK